MAVGLNCEFKNYLEEAIGQENAAVAFSALDEQASVSVRLNPWKGYSMPSDGTGEVPWCKDGRFLSSRPVFTLDPAFHAGAYYVQDSSSMFVGHVFRSLLGRLPQTTDRPLRVLDLCAAPGGKTTDLASSLRAVFGSRYVLVSNEVMAQRASVLASNAAVWGDPCVIVTSDDPSRFAAMQGWFDVILADVPCSGEGMFRKDEKAREQWSADTVRLCQGRQRRIIADVWPALAKGGLLIYSTCTFNRYENDDNVRWISENLGACPAFSDEEAASLLHGIPGVIRTESGFSLVPGFVKGEGQYCSALVKTSAAKSGDGGKVRSGRYEKVQGSLARTVDDCFTEEVAAVARDGFVKALPLAVAQVMPYLEARLHVLSSGCAVGEVKKGVLVPDADMALSVIFRKGSFPEAGLDKGTALSYLKGNPLVLKDCPSGYLTVNYDSLPLGFVKNLGNRCNNLYPRGRRIRMNI